MLKLAESEAELAVSGSTPFGCKILSAAAAYGVRNRNARFWSQESEGRLPDGVRLPGGPVLGMLDDTVLLEAGGGEGSSWEEIAAFVRALGPRVFSCEEGAAEKLGFEPSSRGEIMVLRRRDFPEVSADVEWDPSPREIYSLLERSKTATFHPPEFEPFYMDLSYRTRHGAAAAACVRKNTLPASCAVCTSLTSTAAVISGVACAPEFRGRGLAGAAVLALARRLGRENIYIFRADRENAGFYHALGFEPYGRWVECIGNDAASETKIYP